MKRHHLFIVSAFWISVVSAALADRIVTARGDLVTGRVELERLVLNVDEGEVELPRSSIVEIRPLADILSIRLVDGSWIEGLPVTPGIAIHGDLYARRFEWSEIRQVELELGVGDAATSSGFVRVDDLPRQTGPVDRPPPLRLELDLAGVYELPADKRSAWYSSKLRLFYSDGVSIPVVQVKKKLDKDSFVTLEFQVSVAVQLSYDRMISMEMQLLAEGFDGWRRQETFEVEEGHIRQRRYYLRLSDRAFEGVFGEAARPRLRFVVSAEEA